MEEAKDENPKEIIDKTSLKEVDLDKKDECHDPDVQEGNKKALITNDGNFKVPGDIAFKRPIFNKVPKKSTKQEPVDKPTKQQEEIAETEELVIEPKPFVKSPAEQLVEKSVPLPYKEPSWSGLPKLDYAFEVLKNGVIVEIIPLDKSFVVVGRLAQCDVVLEHPSLSRFHCVIQYRAESSDEQKEGFYAYDLESTHGSFHNKHRMKPHTYYRLHVGHMIKFGGSSRVLILQGPEEDQEPMSELSVTDLKAEAAKRAEKLRRLETGEIEEEDGDRQQKEDTAKDGGKERSEEGINWGMGEDAQEEEEEEEGGVNPFASLNEELYLNDPKKTLRGWFEREGYDLPEYVAEDVSPGVYKCKVDLPIPGPGGGPLVAIVEHKGRKKAAVIQCALEACRLLDKQGVLRQAKHESHEKKRKDWAQNDYYDSDEDDFWDRTGDVQRKRLRRMKDAKGRDSVVETYDSLIKKYKDVIDELSSLEEKIEEAEEMKKKTNNTAQDDDDLDSFMKNLKSLVPDKHKRVNWKLRTVELRKEEMRLRRLANVAKPFDKPELLPYLSKLDASKQRLAAKNSLQGRTASTKEEFALKHPKDCGIKVHKVFLEEEPERKLKLKRLDDKDDEPPPVVPRVTRPKPKVPGKEDGERLVPWMDSIKNVKKEDSISKERDTLPCIDSSKYVKKEESISKQSDNLRSCVEESHEPSKARTTTSDQLNETSVGTTRNSDSDRSGEVMKLKETDDGKSSGSSENVMAADTEKEVHSEKKPRLMGPTLPTNLEYLKAGQQDSSKVKRKSSKKVVAYTEDVAKYDAWVPPSNQTGDGRTSLNDKFGY